MIYGTGRLLLVACAMLVPMCTAVHRAAAQVCGPGGVAVAQADAILHSIPRYMSRDSQVNFEVDQYRVEVSRQQGVLDSATTAYRDKVALLAGPARDVELRKLQQQRSDVQQRVRGLQQQLSQQRQALLQPIERGVQQVVDSVRRDRKCAMILDITASAGILSVNRSLDLTQVIIDRIRTTGDTAIFGPPPKNP